MDVHDFFKNTLFSLHETFVERVNPIASKETFERQTQSTFAVWKICNYVACIVFYKTEPIPNALNT